ncbi:MAG: hypothetical protein AAF696_34185 [Bacteroidota bacterium]
MRLIFLLAVLYLLTACRATQALKFMKMEELPTERISYKGKEIILVSITHFGRQIFYDKLKDSIDSWREEGFRMYYEEINSEEDKKSLDSLSYDKLKRKWRKMSGGAGLTREDYEALSKIFKKGRAQPEWKDLGIRDSDLNADVQFSAFIAAYEECEGEIILEDCDLETPLDKAYFCKSGSMRKLMPFLIDYRNELVKDFVDEGADAKIAIMYGAAHKKGLKKLLKE